MSNLQGSSDRAALFCTAFLAKCDSEALLRSPLALPKASADRKAQIAKVPISALQILTVNLSVANVYLHPKRYAEETKTQIL